MEQIAALAARAALDARSLDAPEPEEVEP